MCRPAYGPLDPAGCTMATGGGSVWLRQLGRYGGTALLLAALAVAAVHARGGGGAPARPASAPADPGTALGGVPAPGFTLLADDGTAVNLADFRGKVVVLAFIDSRCTTVCPLTADVLQRVQHMLGNRADEVQFLAVNVNPLYTSVADVRSWSEEHGMTGRWKFLTGTLAQLRPVWADYHVEAEIVNGAVMHTAAIYIIDRQGREQYVLTSDVSADLESEARMLYARITALLA
jgi:cytochrome oxidase Cu insertion factor (SCO1/SenC/PrrC family)